MDKQQSRREALVDRLMELFPAMHVCHAEAVADFIIAEQERREGPLTRALRRIYEGGGRGAEDALATLVAYGRLDAPPQRTVEQIAADVDRHMRGQVPALEYSTGKDFYMLPKPLMDELAAALRRGKE